MYLIFKIEQHIHLDENTQYPNWYFNLMIHQNEIHPLVNIKFIKSINENLDLSSLQSILQKEITTYSLSTCSYIYSELINTGWKLWEYKLFINLNFTHTDPTILQLIRDYKLEICI